MKYRLISINDQLFIHKVTVYTHYYSLLLIMQRILYPYNKI